MAKTPLQRLLHQIDGNYVSTHQSGGVGDGLGSAVGKSNLVGAGGGGAVPVLVGGEVDQAEVVLDAVCVGVGGGEVGVGGLDVGLLGAAEGGCEEERGEEGLQQSLFKSWSNQGGSSFDVLSKLTLSTRRKIFKDN